MAAPPSANLVSVARSIEGGGRAQNGKDAAQHALQTLQSVTNSVPLLPGPGICIACVILLCTIAAQRLKSQSCARRIVWWPNAYCQPSGPADVADAWSTVLVLRSTRKQLAQGWHKQHPDSVWPSAPQTGSRSRRRSARSSPWSRASSQVPLSEHALFESASSAELCALQKLQNGMTQQDNASFCLRVWRILGAGLVPPGPLGGLVKSISAAQVRGPKHATDEGRRAPRRLALRAQRQLPGIVRRRPHQPKT